MKNPISLLRQFKLWNVISSSLRHYASIPEQNIKQVAGLSGNVLKQPSCPVGPGAEKAGQYKNPEYFSYHKYSFFEAELEMLKYRLPQPTSKNK